MRSKDRLGLYDVQMMYELPVDFTYAVGKSPVKIVDFTHHILMYVLYATQQASGVVLESVVSGMQAYYNQLFEFCPKFVKNMKKTNM